MVSSDILRPQSWHVASMRPPEEPLRRDKSRLLVCRAAAGLGEAWTYAMEMVAGEDEASTRVSSGRSGLN